MGSGAVDQFTPIKDPFPNWEPLVGYCLDTKSKLPIDGWMTKRQALIRCSMYPSDGDDDNGTVCMGLSYNSGSPKTLLTAEAEDCSAFNCELLTFSLRMKPNECQDWCKEHGSCNAAVSFSDGLCNLGYCSGAEEKTTFPSDAQCFRVEDTTNHLFTFHSEFNPKPCTSTSELTASSQVSAGDNVAIQMKFSFKAVHHIIQGAVPTTPGPSFSYVDAMHQCVADKCPAFSFDCGGPQCTCPPSDTACTAKFPKAMSTYYTTNAPSPLTGHRPAKNVYMFNPQVKGKKQVVTTRAAAHAGATCSE